MMATVRDSVAIELRRQDAHQPDVMEPALLEHGVSFDASSRNPIALKKACAPSLKPKTWTYTRCRPSSPNERASMWRTALDPAPRRRSVDVPTYSQSSALR